MRNTYRWATGMAVLCATVIGSAVPAMATTGAGGAPVSAFAPTVCEPGKKAYKVSSVKKPWAITHASLYENYTGSTTTRTESASKQTVLKAAISLTLGAEAKAGVIFAKVESSAQFNVAGERETTKASSVSVTSTMKSGHRYVFFSGRRKVTAQWTMSQCNSRGTAVVVKSRGKATTFSSLDSTGAVRCSAKPKAGTLAAKVKKTFC